MKRIPYEQMTAEFARVLESRGFTAGDARDAAVIFAQNSLAGVPGHGLNRFPRVVDYLDRGQIDPAAKATCTASFGAMERWDGHRGFGPLNAKKAMDRACALAKQTGMGLVALGNNNHWMRGGTYGAMAAEQGLIGICWSNTMPNMPAWGGKDRRIGNNPIILSVPRSDGTYVMVDCALSQFSYGKLEDARLKGNQLPVPGGYDAEGNLTTDPGAIEQTWRVLPMGYWKGSGLSILLDMIADSCGPLYGGAHGRNAGQRAQTDARGHEHTVKADQGQFGLSNVAATMVNLMGYEAPAMWDESIIEVK